MSKQDTQLVKNLLKELWPLHRSITGKGFKKSLDIIGKYIPIKKNLISSGTKVFDWTIPEEWIVNKAYVIDPEGKKILDVSKNNLHLVNYSDRFIGKVSKKTLLEHLYSNPNQPNAIPYVTSYYKKIWGFCISDQQKKKLKNGNYKVVIDTHFIKGSLILGEALIKGKTKKEILISTHLCHPSMANDQLSGPITSILLYKKIISNKLYEDFTFRFLFLPETIGSIAYLSKYGKNLKKNLVAGLVCVLTGGKGPLTYRKSRLSNSIIDRASERAIVDWVTSNKEKKYVISPFNPAYGNDQRQFCSTNFNLPVGCLTNTSNKKTKEYHSSLDNLMNLSKQGIINMAVLYEKIIKIIATNQNYKNLKGNGEPFLSKYKLYPTLSDASKKTDLHDIREALLWLLNYSDGKNDLLKICDLSKINYENILNATNIAVKKKLLIRYLKKI